MRLKELTEKRNAIVEQMQAITAKATVEQRSASTEEVAEFEKLGTELRSLDDTIKMEERARDLSIGAVPSEPAKKDESVEDMEVRSFANYVRQQAGVVVENRAGEQNLTMGNNGAVIPTTIAKMVITTVKDMCPIFAESTLTKVKGTYKVPVWGLANTSHDITVAFQTEFTAITADSGQFTSVDLGGFLAGALTLIGESVANNSEIDVVNFVVQEMAQKIALFLENKLLNGQSSYNEGALATTNTMNAGSISAITADKLIALQAKVKKAYQKNAKWTMHNDTWTAIRQLKDGQGNYLVQPGLAEGSQFMLLGKPVEISDNMPTIASTAKAVLYGDYSGLSVNMREDISIKILQEKYADLHALGIISWFEFDSKVTNHQKLAVLVMSV